MCSLRTDYALIVAQAITAAAAAIQWSDTMTIGRQS